MDDAVLAPMRQQICSLLRTIARLLPRLVIPCLALGWATCGSAASAPPSARDLGLTPGETTWLKAHPEWVIAPSPDFPPIEYFDQTGLFQGITADIVHIMEQKLGVHFRVKRFSSWQEIMDATAKGEVDVWGAATETPERSAMMYFTRPYLSFPAVILTKSGAFSSLTLEQLKNLKVVTIARHVTEDFLTEHYPDLEKIVVPEVPTGLKMVSFGVADAIVVNEATASYYISKLGLTNLVIAGQSDITWPLSLASRRDWPELHAILEKALHSISKEEHDRIVKNWVRLDREGYVSHRTFLLIIAACAGVTVLTVALVLTLNRSLRRVVRLRTLELQEELTERRRVENKLRQSEDRLLKFFAATFEGIFFHVNGKVLDVNPVAAKMFGYQPEDVIGRNITDFVTDDSKTTILTRFDGNDTEPYEVTGIRSDGSAIPLEIRSRSMATGGEVTRVVGLRDLSLRKQREKELHRYQEELVAKSESLAAIRSIADRLHRSLDLNTVAREAVNAMQLRSNSPSVALFLQNEAASHLERLYATGFTGTQLENAMRLPVKGSLSGIAVETRRVVMSMDLAADQRIEPEVSRLLQANGYRCAISVPLLAEEKVLGVLNLLYRDCQAISQTMAGELLVIGQTVGLAVSHAMNVAQLHEEMAVRRKTEKELQQLNAELEKRVRRRTAELEEAKEKAEESDRLKSAFLATMSHELRTPLNSIIGFTGILLMGLVGPLSPEQEKQLNMVQGSARHLLGLINDVLDISKIEAGRVDLVPIEFDINQAIDKSLEKIKTLADRKRLSVTKAVAPEVGRMTGDRQRFEQILINLLSNAVKFTETGGIRIECAIVTNSLVTRVTDSGIGIRPDDIDTIFKPFRQIDSGTTRQYEGTGLGLSICRKLAEVMGGEIRVESQWGHGSTFLLTLPLPGNVS